MKYEWIDETGYIDKEIWNKLVPTIRDNDKIFYYRTTANVRFGFLRSLSQIMLRITSYIRKRCTKFSGKEI